MHYITPRRILLVLIVVPTVVIMLQNLAPASFQMLFWNWEIPLIYIIVGAVAVGFGCGWLSCVLVRRGAARAEDSDSL